MELTDRILKRSRSDTVKTPLGKKCTLSIESYRRKLLYKKVTGNIVILYTD